ncbi:hypothetical protein AXF42_Ash019973 [Apostasia shenzhenica]|uniref:CHCH domain-containing protein n=1 Tax=Apostasia shenzhenica TaxID=1088818 RepID=A0A2I0AZM8_9ASPA|nr:hypothetical protein AXF42_Ash019973 [Apostasia shenzhenica]
MPRRSSAGRSAARPTPLRNPPQPVKQAPPPAVQGGGSSLGGIGGAIIDGIGFGTGSAIAHRAVDAVLGPRTIQHEVAAPAEHVAVAAASAPMIGSNLPNACSLQFKAFQDCISNNGTEISKCQFYLDALNECRHGSSGDLLRL